MGTSAGDPLRGTLGPWLAKLRAESPDGDVHGLEITGTGPEVGNRGEHEPDPDPGAIPTHVPDPHARTVSTVDAVELALQRIRATDQSVRAWVRLSDRAHHDAAVLDEELRGGRSRGPLHGIPIGVKDLVDVAGLPTAAGSRHWSGPARSVASADAAVVATLRRAGALVLGKTTTHEFAFGGTTPPTRNPHDLERIPGGSSGGSAAAVAAGHVRLAVGTDTCGSVRIPASYCGTVGFLPSEGLLPRDGVVPLAWSLDRVGFLAASMTELLWACQALGVTGIQPPRAATIAPLRHLRVGIPRGTLTEPIEPDVGARFEEVLGRLTAAGARIVDVEVRHLPAAVSAGLAIFLAESLDYHRERWTRHPDLFGADVQATLALAEQLSAADYVRAQRIRHGLRISMLDVLSDVDLLLSPTMPTAAPLVEVAQTGVLPIGSQEVSLAEAHLRYNVHANLAALPAGTQPMGPDRRGLPLGLQWVGPPGSDVRLLAAMAATESLLADMSSGRAPHDG